MLARPGVLAERHAPDPHQTLYLCTKVGFPMLCPGPLPLSGPPEPLQPRAVWGIFIDPGDIWETSGKHLGGIWDAPGGWEATGGPGVGLKKKWSKNIVFFCICWRDRVF